MKIILLAILLFLANISGAQTSILSGKISNLNNVNEYSFKIIFIRDGKRIDSINTKEAGFYSKEIPIGFYDLEFQKTAYSPIVLKRIYLKKGVVNINFTLRFEPIKPKPIKEASKDTVTIAFKYLVKPEIIKTKNVAVRSGGVSKKRTESPQISECAPVRDCFFDHIEEKADYSGKKAPEMKAGQVTAGHWRDIDNWDAWIKTNASPEVKAHQSTWGIAPLKLLKIKLVDSKNEKLAYTSVSLCDSKDNIVWTARSDQDGYAFFWPDAFGTAIDLRSSKIKVGSEYYKHADKYINTNKALEIKSVNSVQQKVEIGFVVDATGSMQDEIRFLQLELIDVISRVQKKNACMDIHTASLFYRDLGDEYITRVQPFTNNTSNTIQFIGNQRAGGGGDFPEAVDIALEDAVTKIGWTDGEHAKIMFLLLDAPPHSKPFHLEKLKKYIIEAATKGIRIVPIAASGINKQTEFLMKYMAIITNGEYLYITDDSKIGNTHIKPTGGESKVDYLNDLMVNIINTYCSASACPEEAKPIEPNTKDSSITINPNKDSLNQNNQDFILGNDWFMRYYPNPATNYVNIELSSSVEILRITDLNGRIIHEILKPDNTSPITIDISNWSTGMYLVYAIKNNETLAGKLLIMH